MYKYMANTTDIYWLWKHSLRVYLKDTKIVAVIGASVFQQMCAAKQMH